jgi:glycerate kinase
MSLISSIRETILNNNLFKILIKAYSMKIVIAPDSYKESLTALEVATEIEAGFRVVFPDAEYIKLPMAMAG